MRIHVASFWDQELPNKVSIARSMPRGVGLCSMPKLVPSATLLDWWRHSAKDDAAWDTYSRLFAAQIKQTFGARSKLVSYVEGMATECLSAQLHYHPEVVTLCCWEPTDNPHCHRKLIHAWLPEHVRGECR